MRCILICLYLYGFQQLSHCYLFTCAIFQHINNCMSDLSCRVDFLAIQHPYPWWCYFLYLTFEYSPYVSYHTLHKICIYVIPHILISDGSSYASTCIYVHHTHTHTHTLMISLTHMHTYIFYVILFIIIHLINAINIHICM